MNGDKYYSSSSSNEFICCDINGCNNKATEIIDVRKDDLRTDKLYLCREFRKS
jgi:hypothetical protein